MENYTFNLTKDEVNVIINGLAELPYKFSGPLIQSLMNQLQAQLPKPEATE